ncbi:hypothetical protein BDR22DRAFT_885646 [Usnea florida]
MPLSSKRAASRSCVLANKSTTKPKSTCFTWQPFVSKCSSPAAVPDFRNEPDSEDDLQRLLRASSEKPAGGAEANPPKPSRGGQIGRPIGPQQKRKAVAATTRRQRDQGFFPRRSSGAVYLQHTLTTAAANSQGSFDKILSAYIFRSI